MHEADIRFGIFSEFRIRSTFLQGVCTVPPPPLGQNHKFFQKVHLRAPLRAAYATMQQSSSNLLERTHTLRSFFLFFFLESLNLSCSASYHVWICLHIESGLEFVVKFCQILVSK